MIPDSRIYDLIEEYDLLEIYSTASENLGSDLVMIFDVAEEKIRCKDRAQFRQEMIEMATENNDPDPGSIFEMVEEPAVLAVNSVSHIAFWLITVFNTDDVTCVAVGASVMVKGGDA